MLLVLDSINSLYELEFSSVLINFCNFSKPYGKVGLVI